MIDIDRYTMKEILDFVTNVTMFSIVVNAILFCVIVFMLLLARKEREIIGAYIKKLLKQEK